MAAETLQESWSILSRDTWWNGFFGGCFLWGYIYDKIQLLEKEMKLVKSDIKSSQRWWRESYCRRKMLWKGASSNRHHAKRHRAKRHHVKRHHEKRHHAKRHHTTRHCAKRHHAKRHYAKRHRPKRHRAKSRHTKRHQAVRHPAKDPGLPPYCSWLKSVNLQIVNGNGFQARYSFFFPSWCSDSVPEACHDWATQVPHVQNGIDWGDWISFRLENLIDVLLRSTSIWQDGLQVLAVLCNALTALAVEHSAHEDDLTTPAVLYTGVRGRPRLEIRADTLKFLLEFAFKAGEIAVSIRTNTVIL